jgi:uncharacterized oligopeptide transporter (OPT) family protein
MERGEGNGTTSAIYVVIGCVIMWNLLMNFRHMISVCARNYRRSSTGSFVDQEE